MDIGYHGLDIGRILIVAKATGISPVAEFNNFRRAKLFGHVVRLDD